MAEETEMKCLWLQDKTLTGDCYVQVGKEVVDFSSQYGSERSISYTASNLAGKETIYPGYGDYTQACVFRTYGHWWKLAPSAVKKFKKTPDDFCSFDFIEVSFEEKVYPTKIEVFETYNPGCIVKILACDSTAGTNVDTGKVQWVTLWSGQPQVPVKEAKIFSPPLRKVKFMTDLIRLEICQDLVDYYTELDSIRLHGVKKHNSDRLGIVQAYSSGFSHEIENGLIRTLDCPEDKISLALQDFKISDEDSSIPNVAEEEEIEYTENGAFNCLPGEIIQLILEFLDIPDLCNLAQTCRLLRKHCSDSLLYTELNLQPHWTQIRDSTLNSLKSTCSCEFLQRLNLAWCGKGGILTNCGLSNFLPVCSNTLTYIGLACCQFVDSTTLKIVSENCPNIEEIDLSCCRKVDNVAMLLLLKFSKLKRLNLYRTMVDMHSLIAVIRSCPLLEHLNLGSCIRISCFDDVLIELGQCSKNLLTLDLWQARTLSDIGLKALAHGCPLLQELDLGWCPELRSRTSCFTTLLQECRNLRKLYLTANRTVCDGDLCAIAQYCPYMEQIDILGTREVTPDAVNRVLEKCKNLKFFDVSFCGGILDNHVTHWELQYPYIKFKKSYQS
ncbi:hypothetical protein SNE40_023067 [Patella caerulea]|uniref:F-box domain-containing protein n=1 Tax=Patella caerulea TaxID=87958 RepID=A0AAN8G6K1_PATCE